MVRNLKKSIGIMVFVCSAQVALPEQSASGADKITTRARLLSLVPESIYPKEEKALGHQGTAKLEVDLREDGSVIEVRLKESSGWPALDAAALDVARTGKYSPALTVDGRRVASTFPFKFSFKLHKGSAYSGSEMSAWGGILEVWKSYQAYKYSSAELLKACIDLNFDVELAKQILEADLNGLQDRISWLEKYYETYSPPNERYRLSNHLPRIRATYEISLGLPELRAMSGEAKVDRCELITNRFLDGAETFESFDPWSSTVLFMIRKEKLDTVGPAKAITELF